MAPVRSDTQRCSPRKGRSALSRASNLPADGDKDLEPKDLLQKMSQIVDLLEEDVKRSRREVQKLMTEKETAEKAHANAKGAEEDLLEDNGTIQSLCMRTLSSVVYVRGALIAHSPWSIAATPSVMVASENGSITKPVTAAKLKELFENKHIYAAHYTCPIAGCLTDVENKPIENDLAGNMINTVNDILGPPAKQVDADPHLNEPNVWADIFYDA
ncbi:hypothetical protein BKA82DRAFT_4350635 [Pisolithus tinctorius]|nr:hypothetical protein BKA82DRAFT_4350635 [Pisolithus tinctorius]